MCSRWSFPIVAGIAVVAFTARMWMVLHGLGFYALAGYDQGVYYAAADALVHGVRPYGEFLLLHPPGLMLFLSPFAALGSVTSDATGLAVARFAFVLLGVLNAVLVTIVARRFGRVAAVVGGLFYALWAPVVLLENQTRLEPLGNTCLLLALVALLRWRGPPVSARVQLLAGAALGAGACVKIWGVVPLLVVVGWQVLDRGWRSAVRVAAGAVAVAVAICLPFFLMAPSAMFRMVVTDQLGRPVSPAGLGSRFFNISSLAIWLHRSPLSVTLLAMVGISALFGLVLAWRERPARVVVVLFVAQTALLLKSPSFFPAYAAFVVPAGAVVAAVASERVAGWLVERGKAFRVAGIGALCAAFVVSTVLLVPLSVGFKRPFPGPQLSAAVSNQRCVLSDTPIALIEMNVLSRDLRNGCRVWPDVTGYTYEGELDRGPHDKLIPRHKNAAWHKVIIGYLTSGDAFIVARRRGSGLNSAAMQQLEQWPAITKVDGFTIYARKPLP